MLVWSCWMWITNNYIFFLYCSPYTVWHNPVICKVASAYNITCSCCWHCNIHIIKKWIDVTVCYKLWTWLAVRIWVISVKRLIFPVAPGPFIIVVYLICCHVKEWLYTWVKSYTFAYIYCTHYISFICVYRVLIRIPYDWLCCQVKHYFRLCLRKYLL